MYTRKKASIKTKELVMAAFLTAISIILTRFLSVMLPEVRIGLGRAPIALAGLLFGPVLGGISGAAVDLLGMLIYPSGAYHPGFTISSMLDGLIPGLFSIYFRNNPRFGEIFSLRRIFLSQLIVTLLNSIILNTLWLTQYLGRGYLVLLPARAINAFVSLPILAFIIYSLIKPLDRIVDD